MSRPIAARALPLCCIVAVVPLFGAPAAPSSPEFFETRVRPILATNCYPCHTNSQLGGLRIDSRDALLKGGATGPALVPGDPEKSLLIAAIQQTGSLKMPKGGKLKEDEVNDLMAWVKAGANWPVTEAPVNASKKPGQYVITPEQRAFWSFQPLKAVEPPPVKDAKWANTGIDRFILAHLEHENIKPVERADRRTLIRRASLDLIGLPPTPDEIDAFVNDKSPDAYAKVIDRLLASPHYGERWGRVWLDVARFGEDDYRSLDPMGRGMNPYPNAYLYRDWTVLAFNNDLPYDQFVKAQLAADSMDEKVRPKMMPALGFLGQGPWFYDNGAVEVTHADERHDRIDVVTRGFLGLTVACARCHDHKYDPIPTKDYYSLGGIFASTAYHEYAQVPKGVKDDYDALEKKVKDKEELLEEIQKTESAQLAEALALESSKYMQAAWRITGEPKEPIDIVVEDQKLDYELMERWIKVLAKPPKFYPYFAKWQAMIKQGGTAAEAKKLADETQALIVDIMFEKNSMKEENEIIVAKSLPGTKKKEFANKPNEFITNDDFCPGCGLDLKTIPVERMNFWTEIFSRELTGEDPMIGMYKFRPGLLAFKGWGLERQLSVERRAYMENLKASAEAARKALPPMYPYLHGVEDVAKPVDLPVGLRGSPYNLGEVQPRHFLTVLTDGKPEPFTHGSGRMDLAEAILRQPIAMRVYVNRIWKAHFGTGIVDTPSNFGVAGERPTNPELLEYLAKRFVDGGMSTKKLHREIMMSSVYQLSSRDDAANYAKDPADRLYWRANRHRMDAEQIRDSLLLVAGNLDSKLYGPSADLAPDYTRRTLYGKVSRYHLDEYLQLFDFPSPAISAEKRFHTNVPLQRLFFMNSDFVQQEGELLANRVADAPSSRARIDKMYRILYGRNATPDEVEAGLNYLRTEPLKDYEERKAAAEKEKAKKKEEAAKLPGAKPEAESAEPEAAAADETASAEMPADDSKTADAMPEAPMGGAMLAGMKYKHTPQQKAEVKPMLPVTVWGRYAKILLSSTEFSFID